MIEKTFNIVIVGAGQLGSRYLQGIICSKLDINIFVVDPSQASHDLCHERIREVKKNFDFTHYHQMFSIKNLPREIDLAIIATQADVRFKILKDLADQDYLINCMILEKILFQNIDEYDLSLDIIKRKGIKCWVNCTRRIIPIYKKIKSQFYDVSEFKFEVMGGEWGLISNTIHFLDIISYFKGSTDISSIKFKGLIHPNDSISKRKGIYESSGIIEGLCGNSSFKLISKPNSDKEHVINIENEKINISINELQKKARFINREHSYEEDFIFPNLSEVAVEIIEGILLQGNCGLPDLKTSSIIHKSYIKGLNAYYKMNFNESFCPLT